MLRSPALCVGGQLKTALLACIELCFISVALPSELETWTHSGFHLNQGEGLLACFAIFFGDFSVVYLGGDFSQKSSKIWRNKKYLRFDVV